MNTLRQQLIEVALAWELAHGNVPQITSVLSEYDAARLVGCTNQDYSKCMAGMTAVQRGYDFIHNNMRFQVKGNRPSGKRGSKVTWVPNPRNYEWDFLIWILYNETYEIQEAWQWRVADFIREFDHVIRLSPAHMRLGERLA